MFKICVTVATVVLLNVYQTWGHGRLMDPPNRSSMWRFGFNNEPNYNDNGINCGGIDIQYGQNDGKCGVCGDNFADTVPRANELGGLYGGGEIVASFKKGGQIPIGIQFTASHKGYFEFGICDLSSNKETDDCFENVSFSDGSSTYNVTISGGVNITDSVVQLPSDLTCDHCVLRWQYKAANQIGECDDGTWSTECANQETVRNCADITIS